MPAKKPFLATVKDLYTGEHHLTMYIMTAIVAAFSLVFCLPVPAPGEEMSAGVKSLLGGLHVGGEIFLSILKMMVVPLVVTSVMSGILGMGDVRKLGKPGGAAITYYLCTTIFAVIVGLMVVNVMRPGVGTVSEERKAEVIEEAQSKEETITALREKFAEFSGRSEEDVVKVLPMLEGEKPRGIALIIQNLFLMLFTDNLLKSAMNMDLLPLIVFSIVFAAVLTTMGKKVDGVVRLIEQSNEALMAVVLVFMKVAPIGIFCLVASRFGEAQATGEFANELKQIGKFFITVLVALGIHAFGTLPLIYWFFTRKNPYFYMFQMSRALLTAFSTASSSATLPLTMETAIDKAGISKKSVKFVLPLGATINMDGTALYEAVAAIFVAQVALMQLGLGEQIVVAVTATLAAIGAAGIPEAGLVTMLIVFNAVNLPTEYIGLILSVDWLLDRFRTTVNVFGDAVGAAVVEKTFDKEILLAGEGEGVS